MKIFEFDFSDEEPPTIQCPADMSPPTDSGQAFATVNYEPASAQDNSGSSPTVECDPGTGTQFNIGLNEVTCTATDDAGNSQACTFEVVVEGILCMKFKYFYTGCF